MTQESLRFGRLHLVADAARDVYRHANDAFDQLGSIVAAGACGIDRGDLRRSLDRDGRRLAVEHAMAISAAIADSNRSLAARICGAIVMPAGLEVAEPRRVRTAEERLADLEREVLARLGPVGAQIVEENRR